MAVIASILAIAAGHPAPGCPVVCAHRVRRHDRYELRRRHRIHWHAVTAPYWAWLRSTRDCESGGNYRTNTHNGFYGAYQFTLTSWAAVGGQGMPNAADPLEQDYRAVRLLRIQGRGAWPVCG